MDNIKKCTWLRCNNDAKHKMKAKDGEIWAELCQEHYELHDKDLMDVVSNTDKESIKKMLSNWVKAQGGSKKVSERIFR